MDEPSAYLRLYGFSIFFYLGRMKISKNHENRLMKAYFRILQGEMALVIVASLWIR